MKTEHVVLGAAVLVLIAGLKLFGWEWAVGVMVGSLVLGLVALLAWAFR